MDLPSVHKHHNNLILCIQAQDLGALKDALSSPDQPLQEIQPWYIPRTHAEQDPNYLQIIPYMMVRNWKKEFFVYQRGLTGGEDRLHSLYSIGVGGHVDLEDVVFAKYGKLATDWTLRNSASRELAEELRIDQSSPGGKWLTVLHSNKDEVGKVHVGLLLLVDLAEGEEADPCVELSNSQWLSFPDLLSFAETNELEEWSRLSLDFLKENLKHLDFLKEYLV